MKLVLQSDFGVKDGAVRPQKTFLFEEGFLRGICLSAALEFFYQIAELLGKVIHRTLEARQKVKGYYDGEADGGYGSQYGLFHDYAGISCFSLLWR